jgi:hypothetical protein
MTSSNYAIDKLNASNYNWKSDIKYLLIERSLWEIIEQKQRVPEISTTITAAQVEKFKNRASVRLSLLYLNIELEYRKLIESCTNDPVDA